ncbi:MAG: carbonic anhydrase, partial [Acidobacteria bacterium]|nr:carbonic anhydrase [Acidobacteriota bacterium]NIM61760.1 carbonic anhydrase [Acidobacteriota bacterium]NIO60004.1 carbonic anhydrase [Acidobacteriota bacterium]NIQ29196.1 carbonic anhydrase [Acidobacteriota bacterium]NIQ83770.1 carbonic anhydrase [Acidobacteriota bacterium]
RDAFVRGLVDRAGWGQPEAEAHFDRLAPQFEIGGAAESVVREAAVLRERYPAIVVAPLMYLLADGLLYQVDEKKLQV